MFKRLTIKIGIIATLGVLCCFFVGIAAYSLLSLKSFGLLLDDTSTKAAQMFQAVDVARKIQVDFKIQVQEWKNILLRGNDPELFDKYLQQFQEREQLVESGLVELQGLLNQLGLEYAEVAEASTVHLELGRKYADALKYYDTGDVMSSYRVDEMVKGIDRAPTITIDKIVADIEHDSELILNEIKSGATQRYKNVRNNMVIVILLAGMIVVLSSLYLIRRIVPPLDAAVKIANRIASGYLNNSIKSRGEDEIGSLLTSFQRMNENLNEIVLGVRAGTEQINLISHEIAIGNDELARRTEEQAASLQETSGAMEQMSTTIKQNAQQTKHASEIAQAAQNKAEEAGELSGKAVLAMSMIRESSDRIVQIVSVINEIAFQTNLLALNASVEAARAGEQGRGFAVVAAEVRNLAQRSAGAAKDIQLLIEESSGNVWQGEEMVSKLGSFFTEIVHDFKQVSHVITGIATASSEQSLNITQASKVIQTMDHLTQQNAAMGEEVTASSRYMRDQANNLNTLIRSFKIDENKLAEVKAANEATAWELPEKKKEA